MTNNLIAAKEILATNKTEKASRDLMTAEERNALAEDYAASNHFLSASHFHSDAEKRQEFEKIFWGNLRK